MAGSLLRLFLFLMMFSVYRGWRLPPAVRRRQYLPQSMKASGEEAAQSPFPRYQSHEDFCQAMASMTGDPLEPDGGRVVTFRGNPKAKLVVVGEAPGKMEDELGKPFVGRSGQLLDKILEAGSFDPASDVYVTNIVRRRPPANRDPTTKEVAFYRPFLMEELRLINPAIVVTTGRWSMRAVLGETRGITKVRGHWYELDVSGDGTAKAFVMPWFHPSYLLRNPTKEEGGPKWMTWIDVKEVRRKYQELVGGAEKSEI